MAQKFRPDSELELALNRKYNTDQEIKRNLDLVLSTETGICYGVDLKGELGTICSGISEVSPGYRFNLYNYPFHRLTYIVRGQAKVYNNKNENIADPGCVYYFSPQDSGIVENNLDKPLKFIYIHFTGTEICKLFKNTQNKDKNIWSVTTPAKIQSLFENIAESCFEKSENSQIICDSFLKILLIKLNTMILDNREHPNTSRLKYLECHNYISNNFSSIISIDDIADKCCINSIYLCRLFKKHANISPMAYVTKLKMNKAALMLIQTDYSIKQISIMLNYENQYYFSSVFKKIYGISPKFYRNSH
ncbi:MAG: AraC family transcriptional regulator [Sedimentisphaeraceae bacterium JB056]